MFLCMFVLFSKLRLNVYICNSVKICANGFIQALQRYGWGGDSHKTLLVWLNYNKCVHSQSTLFDQGLLANIHVAFSHHSGPKLFRGFWNTQSSFGGHCPTPFLKNFSFGAIILDHLGMIFAVVGHAHVY